MKVIVKQRVLVKKLQAKQVRQKKAQMKKQLLAQRELEEETGYRAKKWKLLLEYWASPGFLGESMKLFLAEGLIAGEAHPEEDEKIEFRLVKLSDLLKKIAVIVFDSLVLTTAGRRHAASLAGRGRNGQNRVDHQAQ